MKSTSELTAFYYKTLYSTLQELKKKRKNLRHRVIVVGIIYSFIVFLLAFALLSLLNETPDFIFFIGFGYFILGTIIYKFLIKDYTSEFKQNIIKPLIYAIDARLLYNSNHHITQHLFNRSELFSSPDRINGNDYVGGNINGTNIEFSDLHAEKRHKNSKGKDSWNTIEVFLLLQSLTKTFTEKPSYFQILHKALLETSFLKRSQIILFISLL
jgi:predicted tellurium resistance membrane protein TerC